MKLADCVAHCRSPFVVEDRTGGHLTVLNNAADYAAVVANCPMRYVLSDDLVGLCADLAYSKGARTVACTDLLHVPAQLMWVEWCNQPWQSALQRCGFPLVQEGCQCVGRRGALIRSSPDGRRGLIRTFWTSNAEQDVLASSIEAYFDLDTLEGEDPQPPDYQEIRASTTIYDDGRTGDDVLARCFRFRYERTWSDYYGSKDLSSAQRAAVRRHALGTIAADVPMLLAFFLLLATRSGLPQRIQTFELLNRTRHRSGKRPTLSHIEVRSPLLPEYRNCGRSETRGGGRCHPRLHHVRGHLVRRGSQLFWRVPHLRGSARSGLVRTRTVIWTFDDPARGANASSTAHARAPRSDGPALATAKGVS